MVAAGNPDGNFAAHSVPTSDAVLQGVGEGVTQVEVARHVWRWDDHYKLLPLRPILRVARSLGKRGRG